MPKKERIVRYTPEQVSAMPSQSDWQKVVVQSPQEIERMADADDGALPMGWEQTVMLDLPPGKDAIKLRIDRDVLDWFRATGAGYQTRMNAVLRAFVTAHHSK